MFEQLLPESRDLKLALTMCQIRSKVASGEGPAGGGARDAAGVRRGSALQGEAGTTSNDLRTVT